MTDMALRAAATAATRAIPLLRDLEGGLPRAGRWPSCCAQPSSRVVAADDLVVGPSVCLAAASFAAAVAVASRHRRYRHQCRQARQRSVRRRADVSRTATVAEKVPVVEDRGARNGRSTATPGKEKKEFFPAHLRSKEVKYGLKKGRFVQGKLQMMKNTCYFGILQVGQEEIIIQGSKALNRAVDGDDVVVERLTSFQEEAYQSAVKKLRDQVGVGNTALKEAETTELTHEAESRGKIKGRVVFIAKRSKREFVGSLVPATEDSEDPSELLFVPADKRFPFVYATAPEEAGDLKNVRVAINITVWDRFNETPRGRWVRTLGEVGDVEVETEMILLENQIKTEPFSEEVNACLPPEDFRPTEAETKGREDFRKACVFSIDPEGCEDVDDALSCEQLPNGNFRVGVHIADVTHYIRPGTPIDLEAADRATSVYLVDRRIDMLPRLLTTHICSLRCDGMDRLTFSAIFEFNADARVQQTRFCKSVINSQAALSYKEAQARLERSEAEDDSAISVAVRNLNKLAVILRERRMAKGALDMSSQEFKFELDGDSQPVNMLKYTPQDTNKLIEEFMLLANQAVAKQIVNYHTDCSVLRRHPPPKDKFMAMLAETVACRGIKDFTWQTSKGLQRSLDRCAKASDRLIGAVIGEMATRCMEEALYLRSGEMEPKNYYHFGLATPLYTHFTSPIRRYADVLVHRLLSASLGIDSLPGEFNDREGLLETVQNLNLRNRKARTAQFSSLDFHALLLVKVKGPFRLEAIVTRIKSDGVDVTVPDLGVRGPIELNPRDWNIMDGIQQAIGRPLSNFEGCSIGVFDRILVHISADDEDGRNRRIQFRFLGVPTKQARKSTAKGASLRAPDPVSKEEPVASA